MNKGRNPNRNSLWIARKRAGLGQKTVARLLGHRSTSPISEYETGKLLPNLRTAFKLAVIYNTRVRDLYVPLFKEIEEELDSIRKETPSFQNVSILSTIGNDEDNRTQAHNGR
jgi:DNA-binding XRE family transcriptional regulator